MKTKYQYTKTPIEIAREYFPDCTDEQLGYILWNHTGFPCFWDGDPETCMRQQLQDYKNEQESKNES